MDSRQSFDIREQRYGDGQSVDILAWQGDGNKVSISVKKQDLGKLRDVISEFLEKGQG